MIYLKKYFYTLLLLALTACADDGMPNMLPTVNTCTEALIGAFPEFVELPPVGDNGSYDPTLAGDPETGRVWMVFSRVDGQGGEGQVSTHLAFSDDHGTSWCYENQINASEKVEINELPDEYSAAVSAHWSHEVPSLAFDPNAPFDQRWRMTWHRYLHVNDGIVGTDDRAFAYGWIAMKSASSPELLAEVPEIKLFSAQGYYKSAATKSYNDQIGGFPVARLDELHPELSNGVVFTEPGMQVYQDKLYVSLVSGNPTTGNSVVLLSYDNSLQTWSYVSTLLTPEDAVAMNANWTNFTATDIFIQNDQAYLLVSPADKLYAGVLMFEVDLLSGVVQSDANGPVVTWSLPLTSGSDIIQTGVGTYDSLSYNSGIIYGDAVISDPDSGSMQQASYPENRSG